MPDDYLTDLENKRTRLVREILSLTQEISLLDAVIRRRAAERNLAGGNVKVTRKNEQQLLHWGLIRQMLLEEHRKQKGKGLRTREIYDLLVKDHDEIKYTTFRSHLHRLKKDGRISQKERSGVWRLTETQGKKERKIM